VNNIAYDVVPSPTGKKGVVHLLDNNLVRTEMYTVIFRDKTCPCMHWQQSGVPCFHAIKLHKFMKRGNFTKDDFYPWCYSQQLIDMFNECEEEFSTTFPTKDLVESIFDRDISTNSSIHILYPTIVEIPPEDMNSHSNVSSKRIRSVGEKLNGTVFHLTKKRKCLICGKEISIYTRHPPSACEKVFNKINSGRELQGLDLLLLPEKTKIV